MGRQMLWCVRQERWKHVVGFGLLGAVPRSGGIAKVRKRWALHEYHSEGCSRGEAVGERRVVACKV